MSDQPQLTQGIVVRTVDLERAIADATTKNAPLTLPESHVVDAAAAELLSAAKDPLGWGDHVAEIIHEMGADRAYSLVRKMLGLVESCGGCEARRQALNRLEGWVKSVLG